MKLTFGNWPYPIRWIPPVVFSFIVLVWLQVLVEAVTAVMADASLAWTGLALNISLTVLFTLIACYVYKKINTHLSTLLNEHLKLFQNNSYPMWIYDRRTLYFLSVNAAARSLYGYSEKEFMTMRVTDIRLHHPADTGCHRKKDGELIYVETTLQEIVFEGKAALFVLVYDITDQVMQDQKMQAVNQDLERKVMMRTNDLLNLTRRLVDQNKIIKAANLELLLISHELQEANLRVQEHADLKNRFVDMASHEFRTPLANIALYAGFIRNHFNRLEPKNIIAKLQGIESHVSHLATLLDDVLAIGKADVTSPDVKKSFIDLADFIRKISQEAGASCNNSHPLYLRTHDNVLPHIYTDERFLRHIFVNLLNNAIKYSPNGEQVAISVYRVGHETCVEIADNGIGISQQELNKIFEPFYRTEGARNIPGAGLGLSIVKRAADLLGASIRVQSEKGKGSTFTVMLPVEEFQ